MDVYSRRVIGFGAWKSMYATMACEVLKMALNKRRIKQYANNLIHHSDRGGQYMSDIYIEALELAKIRISVCKDVYENGHIERLNGIIKNHYLKYRVINNIQDLRKQLTRTIKAYNNTKPHSKLLNRMSPSNFEQHLLTLPTQKRPTVKLYTGSS